MKRTAKTLLRIANNETFSMSAILEAERKAVKPEDKAMLRRYRNGSTHDTDHIALQEFANYWLAKGR